MAEKKKINWKKAGKKLLIALVCLVALVLVTSVISSIIMSNAQKKKEAEEASKIFSVEPSRNYIFEGESNVVDLTINGDVTFAETIRDDMFTASSFYEGVSIKSTRVDDKTVSVRIDGIPFDNNSEVFSLSVSADAFNLDGTDKVAFEFDCLHPQLEFKYENIRVIEDEKEGDIFVFVTDIELPEGFSFDESRFEIGDEYNLDDGWNIANLMLDEGKLFIGLSYDGDDFYNACLNKDFDIPALNEHDEEITFPFSLKEMTAALCLNWESIDYDARILTIAATVINGSFTKALTQNDFDITVSDNVKEISLKSADKEKIVFEVKYDGNDEKLFVDIDLKEAKNINALLPSECYEASFSTVAFSGEKAAKGDILIMYDAIRKQFVLSASIETGPDATPTPETSKPSKEETDVLADLVGGLVKDLGKDASKIITNQIKGGVTKFASNLIIDMFGMTQKEQKPSEVQKALSSTLDAIANLSGNIGLLQTSIEQVGYQSSIERMFNNDSTLDSKLDMILGNEHIIKYLKGFYDIDDDEAVKEQLEQLINNYANDMQALEEQKNADLAALADKNYAYKLDYLITSEDYQDFYNALNEEGKEYCADTNNAIELYESIASMRVFKYSYRNNPPWVYKKIDAFNASIKQYFKPIGDVIDIWGGRNETDTYVSRLYLQRFGEGNCPEVRNVDIEYKEKKRELTTTYEAEKAKLESILQDDYRKAFAEFMDKNCRVNSGDFAEFMIAYANRLLFKSQNVDKAFASKFSESSLDKYKYDGDVSSYMAYIDTVYNFESEGTPDKQKLILKVYTSYMLGASFAIDYCRAKYILNPKENAGLLTQIDKIAVQMTLMQNMLERENNKINVALKRAENNQDVILTSNQVVSKNVHRAETGILFYDWGYSVAGYADKAYYEVDKNLSSIKQTEELNNPRMAKNLTGIKNIAINVSRETYVKMLARTKALGYSSLLDEMNNSGFRTPNDSREKTYKELEKPYGSKNTYFYMGNISYSSQYTFAAYMGSTLAGFIGINYEQGWKIIADVFDVVTGKAKTKTEVFFDYADMSVWKALKTHRSEWEYLYFFTENDNDLWQPYKK